MVTWNFEGRYRDVDGTNKVECYSQYVDPDGVSGWRPFFYQINTASKFTKVAMTGDYFCLVDRASGLTISDVYPNQFQLYGWKNMPTYVRTYADAGQYTFMGLGADNTVDAFGLCVVNRNQAYITMGGAYQSGFNFYRTSLNGNVGFSESIGTSDDRAILTAAVGTSDPSKAGIVARGRSGQTGNLLEAQDFNGTALFSVNPSGIVSATAVDFKLVPTIQSSTNILVDFSVPGVRTLTANDNLNFTCTGMPSDVQRTISYRIEAGDYDRTLTWDTNLVFIGSPAPTLIKAGDVLRVNFQSHGPDVDDVDVFVAQQVR